LSSDGLERFALGFLWVIFRGYHAAAGKRSERKMTKTILTIAGESATGERGIETRDAVSKWALTIR